MDALSSASSNGSATTMPTMPGHHWSGHKKSYHGQYMTPTLIFIAVIAVSFTFAATVAVRCGTVVLTPRQQTAVRVAVQVALVLSCAAVGAARFVDLHEAGHKQPMIPAAATTASWAAALTLVPVPKALNIFRLFGNGYERLIPYHATLGLITLAAGTLHGAWVVIKQLPKWTDVFAHVAWNAPPGANLFVQMHQTNVAGFLAWSFFVLIAVSSHRRLRSCAFGLWRATHLSFATLAYFFVMVHDPKTVTLLLPGIVFYGAERLMRAVMTVAANARIEEAIAHEEAGVVEVHVRLHGLFSAMLHAPTDEGLARMNVMHKLCCRFLRLVGRALVPRLSAGDFVHVGVLCPTSPSLWRLSPAHPFTVARYDHADRTATFFVKAVGPWTRALLAAAQSDARPLLNARVSWCGPCGSLQVPLDSAPNHLLVCGGVGVTPMISILQALAAGVRCTFNNAPCCTASSTACIAQCRNDTDINNSSMGNALMNNGNDTEHETSQCAPCCAQRVVNDVYDGNCDDDRAMYERSSIPYLALDDVPPRAGSQMDDDDSNAQGDSCDTTAVDIEAYVADGSAGEVGSAVLVWSVRGLALAEALWPTIAPLAAAAAVKVRIFDTSAAARGPNAYIPHVSASTLTSAHRHQRQGTAAASAVADRVDAPLLLNADGTGPISCCVDDELSSASSWSSSSSAGSTCAPPMANSNPTLNRNNMTQGTSTRASSTLSSLANLEDVVECGRPDIAAILASLVGEDQDQEHGGTDADSFYASGISGEPAKVGIFCCGPAGLTSQCFAAATARGNTFVHNEEF